MKKICFLTSSISSLGGVQRVISVLASGLCDEYKIEIVTTVDESFQNIYNLNPNVICKNISLDGSDRYSYKVLKLINQKTRALDYSFFTRWIKQIYYPKIVQKKIIDFINSNEYDIVIGSESYFILLLAIINNQISSKTIAWQHSTFNSYFLQRGRHFGSVRQLTKTYLPSIDKYVVLTQEDKESLDNYISLNSIVINNPLSFQSQRKSNLKNKNIVSIGRLVPMKGNQDLIEAYSRISKKFPHWKLMIYGEGPDYKVLQKLIIEKRLTGKVLLQGQTNDVNNALINSDILVLCSRWEGFGMVIPEAMECGVPVIAYKSPGPCEIIKHEKNGLLVENSNVEDLACKLELLMKDDKKLESLAKYAIEDVKRFHLQEIISYWRFVVEELCVLRSH